MLAGRKIKFPEECWADLEERHPQMKKDLESILNGDANGRLVVIHNDFRMNTEEDRSEEVNIRCL